MKLCLKNKKICTLFKNIFKVNWGRDVIAYDVSSMPWDGDKILSAIDILRLSRETGIWVYDSNTGECPRVIHRSIFSIRKPAFIDSNDLTKEQLDKLICQRTTKDTK